MLNTNTLLRSRKQSKHHRASIHKSSRGWNPVPQLPSPGHYPGGIALSPQTGNTPLFCRFVFKLFPGHNLQSFHCPYSHAHPSRPLSHGFTDSSFCCFCSFQHHQSIDSLRLFALEWLLSPFALYLVGSRVHDCDMSGQDPCPLTVARSQGLELAQRHPGRQPSRRPASAAWQALHPAAGHDWLKQLAHAAG